jgi:hypothetical protein
MTMPNTVSYVAAGQEVEDLRSGDFILVENTEEWPPEVLRFIQTVRLRGAMRKYVRLSHVALVVSERGDIAESLSSGVSKQHLSKYKGVEYYAVRVEISDRYRERVVHFANHVMETTSTYTFQMKVAAAAHFLLLLLGSRLVVGTSAEAGGDSRWIMSSSFVAEVLFRVGFLFPRDNAQMLPADLTAFFGVLDGTP